MSFNRKQESDQHLTGALWVHFLVFFAGGKWWDPKVGFNMGHSQFLGKDSQPDFG